MDRADLALALVTGDQVGALVALYVHGDI